MPEDLTRWLSEAGLGAHAAAFAAEGVGFDVLEDLSEADLKELGLSIGDRKRLARALDARAGSTRPLAARATVEADRRQLSVMFIDLIDSSALAERFDPEEMREVLRVFHEACAAAVEAHEGHIAQYSGDGLLVYFGYPRAHEDDAVRGVLAGLAVIANLKSANERLEAQNHVRLQVRIGIETGLVVAGEVGAGQALDHQAVVGETPIVAARLQTLAPPDTVVVGPATERLIKGSFVLGAMGSHTLKGVSESIVVHRVVSRPDDVDSFAIRAGRGLTPLVGRSAELEMLRQRWNQSRDGEMRGVLLAGEPGIGKSRTLRAFRDCIEDEEHEVVSLHCSPYNRDSPFWPVLQRLQRSFGLDPKAFTDAALERLEAQLGAFEIDTGEAALVLSNLLGIPAAGRYPSIDTASPSFKRRCLNVLVALVEAMARGGPVLLLVEDAHWIDPSTLELVRLLLERLTVARLMLVITARPEFKPDWAYPHLVQINLDRLSRRDRIEMIERLAGGKSLPAVVLDQIIAKTDGVPLFVEELTKTVLQSGLLREAGGRYELMGEPQALAIPDTLQGSLLSRLDRLATGVKEVAQIAATIGREFDRDFLALIAARSEGELTDSLSSLIAAEIILPASGGAGEGGAYLFRHALIQDIAYQSLLLARRRQFHGRIAETLERAYPEVVERQPEWIAQNFAASGDPARAIEYWRRAGERALARAAYPEAIAHAQAGLRLAESLPFSARDRALAILPLLMIRGGAEFRVGGRQAIFTYQQAAQLARTEKLTSFLVEAALWFEFADNYIGGSGEAAIVLMEEALTELGEGESVERCRLLNRLATTLHMTGASDRASDIAGEALVLARRLNDCEALVDALICELMHVGSRPLPMAEFPSRERLLDELRQVEDRLDDDRLDHEGKAARACAYSMAGYLEIGHYQGFTGSLSRMQRVNATGQESVLVWVATSAEAMGAILVGDFALAERKAEESFHLAESVDAELPSGAYGLQMFTIRREQGRLAEVAPLIKRFIDENPGDNAWRPGLMLIASDLGFEAQALRSLDLMAESDFSIPLDSKRLLTLTYLAEVAARLCAPDHAERLYAHLLPFADQAVTAPATTLCCGAASRYLGMLAASVGDWSAAERHFEYALQMDEQLQAGPWLAHTQFEFAKMLSARGRKRDHERAMALTASAASTAEALNMSALLGRISGAGSRSNN